MNRSFYPLILNLKDKSCLVVGAGKVALRKVGQLLAAGAVVTVVSPDLNSGFQKYGSRFQWIQREFEPSDVRHGYYLVFAATSDKTVNEQVFACCRKLSIFCQMVHAGKKSDFMMPAVVRTESLLVAVSTYGEDPRRAKRVSEFLKTSPPTPLLRKERGA